jgi:4-amino-4-deoxy-L-arabinose transferase-like glycosyltransferase
MINGVPVWKPWCHYPVGYSGFLGGLYKVFGSGLLTAPIANAVVGALTVALVHRLALTWLSPMRARLAALLCAFHPGLILYTGLVMTEALSAFSLLLVGVLALSFREQKLGAALSGIALGLGALVRPTALLAGPLLLRVFSGGMKRVLIATAIAGAACLLAIAPWTLRNCKVMDGCALISTNGGWNLAIGAMTDTGRFRTLTGKDGCPIVTGQVQQDRCWGEVGAQTIAANPSAWLKLIPLKLAHTYNHESFATGYLAEANPDLWTDERRESVRTATTVFHHLLMAVAALAGIAWVFPGPGALRNGLLRRDFLRRARAKVKEAGFLRRAVRDGAWLQVLLLVAVALFLGYASSDPEHPLFWLIVVAPLLLWLPLPNAPFSGAVGFYLAGLVLSTSLTHAIFFGDDRYHMTVSPVLCILAAAALRRPQSKLSSSSVVSNLESTMVSPLPQAAR